MICTIKRVVCDKCARFTGDGVLYDRDRDLNQDDSWVEWYARMHEKNSGHTEVRIER